jgi:hypothetical protein
MTISTFGDDVIPSGAPISMSVEAESRDLLLVHPPSIRIRPGTPTSSTVNP